MPRATHNRHYAGRPPLFVLTLAILLVCFYSPASAQTPTATPTPTPVPVTQLSMSGDENDYIGGPNDYFYKAGTATFVANASDNSGDGKLDTIGFNVNNSQHSWSLYFSTSDMGKNLEAGYYPNAQRWPFAEPGHPGLSVYGDGRGCNTLTGSFTIHESKLDNSGSTPKIMNFTASFEQHCEGGAGMLIGTIFYRYTGSQPTYTISGQVVDNAGNPVGGAKIGIKGSRIALATTDSAGNYSFGNLLGGGNYRVVPTPTPSFVYTPVSRRFLRLSRNLVGNFTAIPFYKITGRITDRSGAALADTYVTLSGGKSETVLTDSLGRYTFAGLRADRTYTVTPSKLHYSFSPPSRTFYGLPGNQAVDFIGDLEQYTVGGQILDSNGLPMVGLRVNLAGDQTAATLTDGNGKYQFRNLKAGANYTITPVKTNYSFNPSTLYLTELSGSWYSANFTGTLRTYVLSGVVLDSNANGLEGVTLTVSGSQSLTAVTDSSGRYSFNQLPAGGNYTVTPSLEGYVFTPPSRSYSNLSDHNRAANFIGSH